MTGAATLRGMTVERRRWIWVAAGTAALVVTAGVVVILLALRRPSADAEGRQACQIADNWQKSRPYYVGGDMVNAIHDHSMHSTRTELVSRGDQMYDTWNTVSMQVIAGEITPGERDLRALVPVAAFRAACDQAGYRS